MQNDYRNAHNALRKLFPVAFSAAAHSAFRADALVRKTRNHCGCINVGNHELYPARLQETLSVINGFFKSLTDSPSA